MVGMCAHGRLWLPLISSLLGLVAVSSPKSWQYFELIQSRFGLDASPIVQLPQGKIIGTVIKDGYDEDRGTYPQPVEGFMGIPYALPPLGELRFRPAVPVPSSNATLYATQLGPRCPGKQLVALPSGLGPDWESEDCLTINVFRSQKKHTKVRKLPVSVLIPGGAFNRGAARTHNTPSMLAWSSEPFIAVSMQYRIGVHGGFNNRLTAAEGNLNLGLRDMYAALEWVQVNIQAFGGDPEDVTIMGLSAAAHAIGHLIMDINQPKTLFHKAIMDSGATTARAVHEPDAEINEQHLQEFLGLVSCGNTTDDETLPCLRGLPSQTVIDAGKQVFENSDASVRWAWQPVLDGNIISRRPIDAWHSGQFRKVPILTGFTTHEGSMYVPTSASASSDFTDFFSTLLPQLSSADINELNKLYPDPLQNKFSPYTDTRGIAGIGAQYKRLVAAYGQYAYTCPVRQTAHWASRVSDSAPVYVYHWALNKTALYGANHGDQMRYQTYNREVRDISAAQDEVAGTLHAYVTSFIVSGDPNAVAGRWPNRPAWAPWAAEERADRGKAMLFGEGNDERAGGSDRGVAAQFIEDGYAKDECRFWWKQKEKDES